MSERYVRQVVIPDVGPAGQDKLRHARVLVVGAGGLGSPALFYLAAAGIGTLGIADHDRVALSNLNRQILYTTEDVGRCKAVAASEQLRALNPEVSTIPHRDRVQAKNGRGLIEQYDLVVEASDSLETKALISALCVGLGKPLVWGAVSRFEGQMGTWVPGYACRACIFPEVPEPGSYPTPAELGIVGPTAGVIGSLEAVEVLKVLLDLERPLLDRILLWNGLSNAFDLIEIARRSDCPVCCETQSTSD